MTITDAIKRHDAIQARLAKAKRKAERPSILGRLAKPATLFAMMFSVTLAVVFCETGDLHKAGHIAAIASPLKFAAASLHAYLWGGH